MKSMSAQPIMKTLPTASRKNGFTLLELMVAMAITTIIVTILVSITAISLDAWNRSRAEIRASRQAKTMVDTMARDFEAMVTRRGNSFEWLAAKASLPSGNPRLQSSNAAELYFFTSATDRYQGNIGGDEDLGGDVSCVGYQLFYKDPIDSGGTSYQTFVLNRKLVNPKESFDTLLGQTDLAAKFPAGIDDNENFVCENVYQFSTTFHVEVAKTANNVTTTHVVPLTISNTQGGVSELRYLGTGLVYTGTPVAISGTSFTQAEISAGRITAVEISLTVISDFGIDQLRNRNFTGDQQSEFLNKNSYQYSKRIEVPGM
jgi:prepilin-type N-terminal cleavage/methylation domain-containing protein